MHDIRTICNDPQGFDMALAKRGVEAQSAVAIALDTQRRRFATTLQTELAERNAASKAIGSAKAAGNELVARALMEQVAHLKERLPKLEIEEHEAQRRLDDLLAALPNLPYADVPEGKDEDDNVVAAEHGTHPAFDFTTREHDAIGPALGMDFETGVAIAGARFTLLRGPVAKLQRALGQFMLDRLVADYGYEEVAPPLLVRDEAVYGTGQLPKFAADLFQTGIKVDAAAIDEIVKTIMADLNLDLNDVSRARVESAGRNALLQAERDTNRRWLIPTAEVSLTNIVREKILTEAELPLRFAALTPCFRSEAGAAGRDTRGLIRQHQFDKVEMVSIVTPDASEAEHERMTRAAEGALEALGLPYRRMLLCAGDMGFTAARTYDLEVWLPGQDRYREISSCSTCTDFQARRMNARYRPEGEKGTRFVHTLNGSGLAVGRTLVAVIENYQRADGSVAVPAVLQPYLGGLTELVPR